MSVPSQCARVVWSVQTQTSRNATASQAARHSRLTTPARPAASDAAEGDEATAAAPSAVEHGASAQLLLHQTLHPLNLKHLDLIDLMHKHLI